MVPTPGKYFTPRFSPDGKRLALSITAGKGTDLNVWDLQREAMSHLTFNGQDNFNPVWTPDGKHIVFRSSLLPIAVTPSCGSARTAQGTRNRSTRVRI